MKKIDEVAPRVLACTRCGLHLSRRNAVPGEGRGDAEIVLVGEAPGRTEDETGRPFVGRAGGLLDRALAEAGLDRSQVFITNAVKCRPPGNRRPTGEEVEACSVHLAEQLDAIRPRVIVALGAVASSLLKGCPTRVDSEPFAFRGIRVVPTYHPAAALHGNRMAVGRMVSTLRAAKEPTRGSC
ncbi:MAG: uracil-DNA glycosylase [Nitrososphaerota archaeon]|nr:uracil-DNA glycosylase [Nitrososphaerota archaeon]MDG6938794.1 uracil-DNA glycosylase [Nitrososphaerota archaeon]